MNRVFLIGNLTRDPELGETSNGVSVCRFWLAVNRNYVSSDGERKTDFFNCIAWRSLGEAVSRYAKKGNKLSVTGSLEQRSYDDSQGVKRTVYEVNAQEVEFLTPRSAEELKEKEAVPVSDRRGTAERAVQQSFYDNKPQLQPFDDDDDIPF